MQSLLMKNKNQRESLTDTLLATVSSSNAKFNIFHYSYELGIYVLTVILSVVIPSVIMLSVKAPYCSLAKQRNNYPRSQIAE
jgi:hypothetical protein